LTPIVPVLLVIEARNNRGFWLPVTVVVISHPLELFVQLIMNLVMKVSLVGQWLQPSTRRVH